MRISFYIGGGSIPLELTDLLRRLNRPAVALRTLATICLRLPDLEEQIQNELANGRGLFIHRSKCAIRAQVALSDATFQRIHEIAIRLQLQPVYVFERMCVLAWNICQLTHPLAVPNPPTEAPTPNQEGILKQHHHLPQTPPAAASTQTEPVPNNATSSTIPDFSVLDGFEFPEN